MKTLKVLSLLLLTAFVFNSCSSDESNPIKNLPEKFDIKIEIKGSGSSPKSLISINSSVIKQWEYKDIPFEEEYTYYTTGQEVIGSSCKCITISAWAYLSDIDEIKSFNLYINGELVDSKSAISPPTSDGILTPTTLEFIYNP